MEELKGKEVEIITADIIYRGILTGATDDEVYIQTDSGWLAVPFDKIADIKAVEK